MLKAGIESLEERRMLSVSSLGVLNSVPADIKPHNLVAVGDKIVFMGSSAAGKESLWVSDGSSAGTRQIANVRFFGDKLVSGDELYFVGVDDAHSQELWRTDGTAQGTVLLTDVNKDTTNPFTSYDNINLSGALAGGSILFAVRTDAQHNLANTLWRSDGTLAGTVKLSEKGPDYDLRHAAKFNGRYYYGARPNPTSQADVWSTDGTSSGTQLEFTLPLAPGASAPSQLWDIKVLNGQLLLLATATVDEALQLLVYTSDGTAAGTSLVRTLSGYTGNPTGLIVANGLAYFNIFSHNEASVTPSVPIFDLWRTDGTADGTLLLDSAHFMTGDFIGTIGHKSYFLSTHKGAEGLWVTDGTVNGTAQVVSLQPAAILPATVRIDNQLYFTATDTDHGTELWRTDGTAAGTQMAGELRSGKSDGVTSNLVSIDEKVYLGGNNGTTGLELWRFDPGASSAAFSQVYDVPGQISSAPTPLLTIGNTLYFTAAVNDGVSSLWKTDGTPQGTIKLMDGVYATTGYNVGGVLYAVGSGNVWRSDGTAQGTQALFSQYQINWAHPAFLDGRLFVSCQVPYSGALIGTAARIYVIDSAAGDPNIFWESHASGVSSYVFNNGPVLYVVEGHIYFNYANYRLYDNSWYRIDGDTVVKLTNNWTGPGPDPGTIPIVPVPTDSLTVNGVRYYAYDDGAYGSELWQDDGTTQQQLTDLNPGPLSASPFELTAVNGYLVFAATTPQSLCTVYSIPLQTPAPAEPTPTARVTFVNGVLNIQGTDGDESILLCRRVSKPNMCKLVVGSAHISYRFKEIKKILVDGDGGDDTIRFEPSVGMQKWSVKLRGGAGNDVIQGSPAADWISGGDGNDWINAGGGNDTLSGDAGDDRLFGGDGKDVISGGAGANVLRAGAGKDRILYHVGLDNIKGNDGDRLIKSI